jgi:hypothetical protein
VAVCAIPFALAQRNAAKRGVAKRQPLSAIAKLQADCAAFDSSDFCTGGHRHFQDGTAPASSSRRDRGLSDERVVNARDSGGVCQFHVLIVYADSEGLPTQLQSEIQAEPNVVAVDLFDATVGTPTLGQLQQYEIVVPFSNSPFLDGDTLGNNLADYVDGGGIVVQYGFAIYGPGEPYGINGRWVRRLLHPYDYSENLEPNPFSLGTFNAGAPAHGWG